MNTSGNMLEEYNYDPCLPVRSKAKAGGRRRNPTNWSYTGVSTPTYTNRGFTGLEHLDMFELIHMNGRIYDPEIARFLSPDPVIQDPYSIFSYNRYSYCLNNPLKYVDPSGLVIKRPEEFEWQDFSWTYSLMDRITPGGGGGVNDNNLWQLYQQALNSGYDYGYGRFMKDLSEQSVIVLSSQIFDKNSKLSTKIQFSIYYFQEKPTCTQPSLSFVQLRLAKPATCNIFNF